MSLQAEGHTHTETVLNNWSDAMETKELALESKLEHALSHATAVILERLENGYVSGKLDAVMIVTKA